MIGEDGDKNPAQAGRLMLHINAVKGKCEPLLLTHHARRPLPRSRYCQIDGTSSWKDDEAELVGSVGVSPRLLCAEKAPEPMV